MYAAIDFTECQIFITFTACGSTGSRCLGSYCSGSYYTGSSCVDGYCRCANNPERDYCTCLGSWYIFIIHTRAVYDVHSIITTLVDINFNAAISGQCRIQRGSSSAVGTPTFNGATQTNYSCVANENCNYDVHVISNYEGDYNHGFGPVTRSGSTNVRINIRGQVYRPLVLVFVSYEPVNWILSLSSGVTIEKVLLVSQFTNSIQPSLIL